MNAADALRALLECGDLRAAEAALGRVLADRDLHTNWTAVGRENNVGTIGAGADPGRSLVERITNAIDGVLERARHEHDGTPPCRSPREAASAWLGVPQTGIGALSRGARRALAGKIDVSITNDEGWGACVVTVADQGIGISPDDMPRTILGLNESNKVDKLHLWRFGTPLSAEEIAASLRPGVTRSLQRGPGEPGKSTLAAHFNRISRSFNWVQGRRYLFYASSCCCARSGGRRASSRLSGVRVDLFALGRVVDKVVRASGYGAPDEVVSSTFARLARRPERTVRNLEGYVRTCARHELVDARRREERERARVSSGNTRIDTATAPPIYDPILAAQERELSSVIAEGMNRLSSRLRLIAELAWRDRRSHSEIAAELMVTVETVESQLSRARQVVAKAVTRAGWAIPRTLRSSRARSDR